MSNGPENTSPISLREAIYRIGFTLTLAACNGKTVVAPTVSPESTAQDTATMKIIPPTPTETFTPTNTPTETLTETPSLTPTETPTLTETPTPTENIPFKECGGKMSLSSAILTGPKTEGGLYLPTGFRKEQKLNRDTSTIDEIGEFIQVCLISVGGINDHHQLEVNAGYYDTKGVLHPVKIFYGIMKPNGDVYPVFDFHGSIEMHPTSMTLEQFQTYLQSRLADNNWERRILNINATRYLNPIINVGLATSYFFNLVNGNSNNVLALIACMKAGTAYPGTDVPVLISNKFNIK